MTILESTTLLAVFVVLVVVRKVNISLTLFSIRM